MNPDSSTNKSGGTDNSTVTAQDVTIVFITYNSSEWLDAMLGELDGFNVLVYDNASGDDTVSQLQKNYPQVRLHSNAINSGYGRASNAAFRMVNTPYALLINPDVEIRKDAIIALIDTINRFEDDWLFVAPQTGEVPTAYEVPTAHINEPDDPLPRIRFATGCALLFNLRNHWILNGFDENIFLFFEETDLCERAVKANIKMYYAESIKMPHASGQSVKPSSGLNTLKRWHYHWSYLYFCKKHGHWAKLYGTLLKNLLIYPIKLCFTDKNSDKAHVYKTRRAAALAFIGDEPAFIDNEQPYIP